MYCIGTKQNVLNRGDVLISRGPDFKGSVYLLSTLLLEI